MKQSFYNIYHLGIKELQTLFRDKIMLSLIVYSFSFAIYIGATSASTDIHNASIAFVDEDRSRLSQRIISAFYKPRFNTPEMIAFNEINTTMDSGYHTFVVVIPSEFEKNILKGERTDIQLNIDATRMTQAGVGSGYIQAIISQEIMNAFNQEATSLINLVTTFKYNPNLTSTWFGGINEIISNIMMLSILLSGAALMREREHGTIEHLLVMPLNAAQIMLSKIWSMGLVILIGVTFSLVFVVELILQIPLQGSLLLFLLATLLVLLSTTSMGIFMATLAQSMPQLGMLFILIILPLLMLSGGISPYESMPEVIQYIMYLSPTSHYMEVAQAILFRGADITIIWGNLLAICIIGVAFFIGALLLFKQSLKSQN
jgi:ABC-2 type transport system permease protein